MTKKEAITYISNYKWNTSRPGLARITELMHRLGDPQETLRFVHITGSNGKGSTAAMLESILRKAGYRTGLFTSPEVTDFCDRIRVCGRNISARALGSVTEAVSAQADLMEDHPTQFELLTAVGLLYFARKRCEIVILEVGMGGELDSTNVIPAPELCIFTNIGLEHTEYLGNTIEEIARTKGGILKPGCSAVLYDGAPEAGKVIGALCEEKGIPLYRADFSMLELLSDDVSGCTFRYRGKEYRTGLTGSYQQYNAAVGLEAAEALKSRGFRISEEAVAEGLAEASWPARFEIVRREDPMIILDAGHNPQCAEALAAALRAFLPGRKVCFLTGMLADKDYMSVIRTLLPLAEEFICLTPESGRALPGYELAERIRQCGGNAVSAADTASGLSLALSRSRTAGALVVFGSFYLVGPVRKLLK